MQQTIQLAPSVVEDLVELASDANSNVRKQALMIILQSIDDRGNRLLFLPTKFLKVLLNLIGDEECCTSALSIVIQFSQDDDFSEQLVTNKAVRLISDRLKELVLGVFKDKRPFREQEILLIDLSQLALSNLTQQDAGMKQLLQADEDEAHYGFNLRLLIGFVLDGRSSAFFKHFLQVVLNLTSFEESRLQLIKGPFKIFEVLNSFLAPAPKLIPIQTLKNLLFEYELDQVMQAITEHKVIDTIIGFISYDLYFNWNYTSLTQEQIQAELNLVVSSETSKTDQFIPRMMEAIKCLLILTNVDLQVKNVVYNIEQLERIIYLLRKVKGFDSSVEDQLDVIDTCMVNAMKSTMQQLDQLD